MNEKIKETWRRCYEVSANKHFTDLIRNLSKGGHSAKEFVNTHREELSLICNPDQLLEAIGKDRSIPENKAYFFGEALKSYVHVKNILQKKYEAVRDFMEINGVSADGMTPANALSFVDNIGKLTPEASGNNVGHPTNPPTEDDSEPIVTQEEAAPEVPEEKPTKKTRKRKVE